MRTFNHGRSFGSAGAVLLTALLLVWSCGDGPTGPGVAKDYPVYFNAGTSMRPSYRYHPESRKLDTLTMPYNSDNTLAVSADGSTLYLAGDNGVAVVAADSLTITRVLPYHSGSGGVATSRDGRYVVVAGDGFFLLRAEDYALAFSDTGQMSRAAFSHDGSSVFCIGGYDPGTSHPYVYRLSVLDSGFVGMRIRPNLPGLPWRIVPIPFAEKWLLLLKFGLTDYRFAVYDVALDSLVFAEDVAPGAGDIEVTPDGRYAFYSNPGTTAPSSSAPSSAIFVYNIEANQMLPPIPTDNAVGTSPGFFPIGSMTITPDGSKLIGLRGPFGGEAIVVNVNDFTISENLYLTTDLLGEVSCQSAR